MEYINTHTHTGLTGHGNGTIAEVVQAADKAGISILALTEHFPLSRKVDPDNFVSMPWDALDPYVREIEAQRALHKENHLDLRSKDPLARYGAYKFSGAYSRIECSG